MRLGRLDHEKTDIVQQGLVTDVFAQSRQDRFADHMGRLPMALFERLADSLYSERDVGPIRRFRDAIGIGDHHVAGL